MASAIALGASAESYLDDDRQRLRIAETLGAHVTAAKPSQFDEVIGSRRFPITVDACILDDGRRAALRAVAPCGTTAAPSSCST